ncbi:MAG: hypothetical protein WC130_12400 [Kiritimatiellia bacterium]
MKTITIIPNPTDASWIVTGPDGTTYCGRGKFASADHYKSLPDGVYKITWGDMPSLITPCSQTLDTVAGDGTYTFYGPYARLLTALDEPMKISGLTMTKHGLFGAVYNNDSRKYSALYRHAGNHPVCVYEGSEETIGQGVEYDGYVLFPGECGYVLAWHPDPAPKGTVTRIKAVNWAVRLDLIGGIPHVFDTDKYHSCRLINLVTGAETLMPGDGVVNMSIEHGNKIFAAMCNSDSGVAGGLSCSDGTLRRLSDCRCIVQFNGHRFYSNENQVFRLDDHALLREFDCEKICHMDVNNGLLWISGAGPDALWVVDSNWRVYDLYRFEEDSSSVGRRLFCGRVTNGYFSRNPGGVKGAAYQILMPAV